MTIEQEIQAKSTAPRVTLEQIEGSIDSVVYFNAAEAAMTSGVRSGGQRIHSDAVNPSLHLLTICVLTLDNGFTVTGTSACASPANFDPEIGKKVARADAIRQCWALFGFALRNELATKQPT
jgi:hypothetical protein